MATISGINYKKIVTTGAESYDLLPFDQTFGTPLQQMIIEVDSTLGTCDLNLPDITLFNGNWETKLTIIATKGFVNPVTIIPNGVALDTIGGNSSLVLTLDGQVAELNIATDNNWYGVATI